MKFNIVIFIVILVFLITGSIFFQDWLKNLSFSKYDDFAKCLKNKGVVFYGGFWCSHCKNQKDLFGLSEKYLPYFECSTADGLRETQICKDAGVRGYPTWKFADGTMLQGELKLSDLAQKSGCILPK